ncbi:hypothetical protein K443DRAFT_8857 [Laccaria amethystina LaAM-08-1]|uniref:Uncharacterized protein n=1 Tax=Laccaria amethystina LaAM-08-1 TaxID=1095629 RepID=A0A0C9X120_9AGAR|nr:hypothetical protein K443DRAFT_8857 [Laccaria amethystina LaAM-08-1]
MSEIQGKNFLEPKPEPELEPNFAFSPEGLGLNRGSGPNFSNANYDDIRKMKLWPSWTGQFDGGAQQGQ